jgi:hypothetical protein
MPNQVLFFIHGVGQHGTKWAEGADGPIETLKEASRKYEHFKSGALENRVDLVPVSYDDLFVDVIAAWQANANAIDEFDSDGTLRTALGWLADADEKKFWWSHAADAAMYRLSFAYRQMVRSHVINQLATRIKKEFDEEGSATCSVLAHSLGTAVAHDSLHYLGTTEWGKSSSPFHPTHWRFNHIFMLANTSRLLQTTDEGMMAAYQSIVRPGPVEDPASYCGTYWSFRHEMDPIAWPRRFDPAGWADYSEVVTNHYRQANIHGLSHYLLNPSVHIPILRRVVKKNAVTLEEEIAAVNPDNFPQFDVGDVAKARKHLVELTKLKLSLGSDPSLKVWIKGLIRLYQLAEGNEQ